MGYRSATDGLTRHSDGDTPEKQAEQILAIYPILKGQRDSASRQIPARAAPSEGAEQPTSAQRQGDLIDASDSAAATGQAQKPSQSGATEANGSSTTPGEVESMLNATGQHAQGGPLLDFQSDLKKDLPKIKRSDTQGSHDEFVDANE
jgi:hypothetical protein